jgi:hemerythrin
MVQFVVWKDEYSVKVHRLDEQHKTIIKLINDLYDMFSDGEHPGRLGSVLSELIQYINTHFAYEEQLMRQAGYPEIEAHTVAHRTMVKRTIDLCNKYNSDAASISQEVFTLLKEWLVNHIIRADSLYAPYVSVMEMRLRKSA